GTGAVSACAGLALLAALALPATAAAIQWPGELSGRIVDSLTGTPLDAVEVLVEPGARKTSTDASGGFRLRGLEPGSYRVSARRLGYGPSYRDVEIQNGVVARVALELTPMALEVSGITATVESSGGIVLLREAIIESGARTAGDALRAVPGIVVQEQSRGGPQRISVRGANPDAVLVLLDGVPLNDPVTGEADLSTVPARSLARATVLAGALSARFGPRAAAGVILLESSKEVEPWGVSTWAGSLGQFGLGLTGGRALWNGRWNGRVEGRGLDGGFGFTIPAEAGGGEAYRDNADLGTWSASTGWSGRLWDGDLSAIAGFETLERGLPGRSFAPSPTARQDLDRMRFSTGWNAGALEAGSLSVRTFATRQTTRFRDAAPPFGASYDERTVLGAIGASVEGAIAGVGVLRAISGGVDVDVQSVESDALGSDAPPRRTDLGLRASGTWSPSGGAWSVSTTIRGHWVGRNDRWHGSHEVALNIPLNSMFLRVAHRSAFSPPTLGDQFFREGVGVEPNPDLRAERVPSEIAAELSWARTVGRAGVRAFAQAYRGDMKGMIVWLPDFRFVWSPRNVDVRRSGGEAGLEVKLPQSGLSAGGSFTLTRATYDRATSDDVQVAYRPRYGATLNAGWQRGPWSLRLASRFTGARFPVPAPVNELPGFWVTDFDVGRLWRFGGWSAESRLRIERLFDVTDALIFAYPDPGRTLRLELRVGPIS
ncbi:MAG: TonB-dependent receptor, partial [Longimicrobiales bacterium]